MSKNLSRTWSPIRFLSEAPIRRCSSKSAFLKFWNIHTKTPVFESLFKKETPTQVFSCEYSEIFRTPCFYRRPPAAASVLSASKAQRASSTATNDTSFLRTSRKTHFKRTSNLLFQQ